MHKLFRWLALGAFSAGLCIGLDQRARTALGAIGLFVSFFGLLFGLGAAAPESLDRPHPHLHETVVAESFEDLSPLEAAALVGVLHEYRIGPVAGGRRRAESLELHSAADLVSRASGLRRDRLMRLYRDHWCDLRQTIGPGLVASLESHRLVARVYPYHDRQ